MQKRVLHALLRNAGHPRCVAKIPDCTPNRIERFGVPSGLPTTLSPRPMRRHPLQRGILDVPLETAFEYGVVIGRIWSRRPCMRGKSVADFPAGIPAREDCPEWHPDNTGARRPHRRRGLPAFPTEAATVLARVVAKTMALRPKQQRRARLRFDGSCSPPRLPIRSRSYEEGRAATMT